MKYILISHYDMGVNWNVYINTIGLFLNSDNYQDFTYDDYVDNLIDYISKNILEDYIHGGLDEHFNQLCDNVLEHDDFDNIIICSNGEIFIKEKQK